MSQKKQDTVWIIIINLLHISNIYIYNTLILFKYMYIYIYRKQQPRGECSDCDGDDVLISRFLRGGEWDLLHHELQVLDAMLTKL